MNLRSALTLSALVAAAAAGTTSASSGAASAACGTIPGPAWVIGPTGEKGNTYKVVASGVACAFAKTWATKLVRTPYRGEAGTHLTGPAGWSCLPTISWGHGTPGTCRKGSASFGWGVNAKKTI
jgi:hypothetical protein